MMGHYRRSIKTPGLFPSLALVPMSCLGVGFARSGNLDPRTRKAIFESLDQALA